MPHTWFQALALLPPGPPLMGIMSFPRGIMLHTFIPMSRCSPAVPFTLKVWCSFVLTMEGISLSLQTFRHFDLVTMWGKFKILKVLILGKLKLVYFSVQMRTMKQRRKLSRTWPMPSHTPDLLEPTLPVTKSSSWKFCRCSFFFFIWSSIVLCRGSWNSVPPQSENTFPGTRWKNHVLLSPEWPEKWPLFKTASVFYSVNEHCMPRLTEHVTLPCCRSWGLCCWRQSVPTWLMSQCVRSCSRAFGSALRCVSVVRHGNHPPLIAVTKSEMSNLWYIMPPVVCAIYNVQKFSN